MALHFNTKTLFLISTEVSTGNPRWGLFLANQYLSPEEPLRLALANKARLRGLSDSVKADKAALSGDKAVNITECGAMTVFRTKVPTPVKRVLNNRRKLTSRWS